MKKTVLLLILVLASSVLVFAQTGRITGRVTDESGAPVAFATVSEKGTQNAVSADEQGNFSITAKVGASLEVSSAGFQSRTVTATAAPMEVTLAGGQDQTIDEVVVTALGVSKEKRALGYATQTVKADQLVQAANTDLAGALQGKTSGIEIRPSSGMPGASSLITIRGARSFTGNNSPLYVIDGMPISSAPDLSTGDGVTGSDIANRGVDIDPNDIASVEILKGQAASALYGIRASNGVIVITTKSGKGAPQGKPIVTFNSNMSFDRLSRFPEVQTTYAQGAFNADGVATYSPTQSSSWGPKITDLPNDPAYGGNAKNKYTDADGLHNGMYYVPQRAAAGLDPWATPQVYNNIKDFFQTGTNFSNSVNVMQATDKMNYSFSLGSANQKGIMPHTGMDRYNAKLSAEATLSDHFKTSFSGNFVTSDIDKMTGANDGVIATIYPAPSSYNLKGIPDHLLGDDYAPNNYRAGAFTNPYWATRHNSFNEKTDRFFGNTNLTYLTDLSDRIKLNVKYQIGTDAYTTNYQDIWSYGMPNKGSNNNGQIEEYSFTNLTLNSLLTANLTWAINSDMNFSALLGNEIVNTRTKYNYAYGSDFTFSGWNHMDNTATKDAQETTNYYRNFGNFFNLNYDFKRMLYLGVTGRVDRVSSMPANNRTFFYPSVSLGFVFTELNGLKGNDVLNYGKLRLSYAQVGQAGTYLQNYYSVPAYGGGFYGVTPILYPINGTVKAYIPNSVIYDPNLKPQNTGSYEAGVDLNFLKNLVEFSYTYSRQNVTDQIFDVPLAGSTGASALRMNGGKIHTNVHEATVTINAVRKEDVEWSIGANFSKIDNYVDELAPGVESIFLGGFTTPQVRAGIGDKFPVIYGSQYLKNDKGQLIVDANGFPQAGAPGVIGSVAPDFILGGNTRFRYKFLTLSAVVDWKSGGQMYSGTTGLMDNYGMSKATEEARNKDYVFVENAVKEDGTPNDIVIKGAAIQRYFQAVNGIDESSISGSSFVKLRELALRVQALKKKNLNLGVNLFARNLLLWTNSPLIDPESSQGNTNMGGAFERFTLPQTSSFGVGLNLQF